MRAASMACAYVACVTVLVACGDDGPSGTPIDAAVDGAEVDAPVDAAIDAACAAPAPGTVGGPCTADSMCDSLPGAADGFCLRGPLGVTTWPAIGFCVNQIGTCTALTCGPGNECVTVADPGGDFAVCVPACAPAGCTCAAGQVCTDWFAGAALRGGARACLPGDPAATDGDVCLGFGECAADSICPADPLEYPAGQCQVVGCTIGSDATCAAGGDGHCVDRRSITAGVDSGTVCVDRCVDDTGCRMADGYRCLDGGGAVGRYCRHPQAGDACAVDTDCGNPVLWDCKVGLTFPGGMCTPTTGCPTAGSGVGCSPGSSICYDSILPAVPTDNVCVDRCGGPQNTQGGCRAGYVCRDVDPAPGPNHVVLGCVNP